MTSRACPRALAPASGFSVIELLVALSVVAIMAAAAAPGFRDLAAGFALDGAYNRLARDLRLARSEAIVRQGRVSLCARADATSCGSDWTRGWHVFAETAGGTSGRIDAGERLLSTHHADGGGSLTVQARAVVRPAGMAAASSISFDARGRADWTVGTLSICDARGASEALALVVNGAGGFRRASESAASGGVVVDAMGDPVSCPG